MRQVYYVLVVFGIAVTLYTLNDILSTRLLSAFVISMFFGTAYSIFVRRSDNNGEGALSPWTAILVIIGVTITLLISLIVLPVDHVKALFVLFAGSGFPMWLEYEDRHRGYINSQPIRAIAEYGEIND